MEAEEVHAGDVYPFSSQVLFFRARPNDEDVTFWVAQIVPCLKQKSGSLLGFQFSSEQNDMVRGFNFELTSPPECFFLSLAIVFFEKGIVDGMRGSVQLVWL